MTTRFVGYITKYALTAGIQEVEVEECNDPTIVSAPGYIHYFRSEWHRTRAEAVKRAKRMRVAKIASLRKSIAKLEGIVFE